VLKRSHHTPLDQSDLFKHKVGSIGASDLFVVVEGEGLRGVERRVD